MTALIWPRRAIGRVKGAFANLVRPAVHRSFFTDLIRKTENFGKTTWLGRPIWQNVLDLWTIQETIYDVKPELLIECGTNRGGSSYFYAQLFDLMGKGRVVTIDIEKMHDLAHPRVKYILGSSVAVETLDAVQAEFDATAGPVMVILDSDHSRDHVAMELEAYNGFVTPGSYILAQDGVMDTLPIASNGKPGPLPAILNFLTRHPEFEVDRERNERFIITHHPMGWMRRRGGA
jgi:cephalosporin hydroxylase